MCIRDSVYSLRAALRFVARYVDWLIDDTDIGQNGRAMTEELMEVEVADDLTLKGKLDLTVYGGDGAAHIVDYKTGNLPFRKDVLNGNEVQLACYALLEGDARRVTYVNEKSVLEVRHEIEDLKQRCRALLVAFKRDYEQGLPLPARGRDQECKYCPYDGLCRKPAWRGDAFPAAKAPDQ